MMAGRYAHAKQFNRHRRQLRFLRIRLGRLIRDIRRKITGLPLEAAFQTALARAVQTAPSSSASAAGNSIRPMPRRSSASAKARPAHRGSSA